MRDRGESPAPYNPSVLCVAHVTTTTPRYVKKITPRCATNRYRPLLQRRPAPQDPHSRRRGKYTRYAVPLPPMRDVSWKWANRGISRGGGGSPVLPEPTAPRFGATSWQPHPPSGMAGAPSTLTSTRGPPRRCGDTRR
ncbi:hypothetical protein GALMADRAFT_1258018 [Galerina marginata CBS 339.88]|uniref:Uncharacterized protein n=1 Tax=Galerina marginata (strain CBS 339.88) TaxID=685588 RepID=A0A067THZ3_GALM3|nr:hypothetical protein GALMADRAFT_1258018 [Galerina marginata CBS 339.88]